MSTYKIDPSHSTAGFSVKHMMIAKVHGAFEKMSGTLNFDPKQPLKSSVDVVIEAASINTHEAQRDAHLKSPDFFDIEKYPTLTFKSLKVESAGDDLKVIGNLTLHGVTKQVTLNVEGPTEELKDPMG